MRHPLHAAVTGLWTLGGIYLGLAGMPVCGVLLDDGFSVRAFAWVALIVAAPVFYLIAASRSARQPRVSLLVLCASVTALLGVALLLLLGLLVTQVGLIDLLQPRNVSFAHLAAAALIIFIAYHGWVIRQLIRAYDAAPFEAPLSRGFTPNGVDVSPSPLPVLPVDDRQAVTAPPASPQRPI